MRKCENVTKEDGRLTTRIIEGTDHDVEFDSMLVAISANVDYSVFEGLDVEMMKGWPVTDDKQQTSVKGLFVAGDFILGQFRSL